MNIYTLYVKTHRITGLKYLGKTEREDPVSYQGSGVYWTSHIKKHGYDCDTQIIKECNSKEELKEAGLYYSKLWNVVESDDWANLKDECGEGWSSDDAIRLTRERIANGTHNCLKRGEESPRFNSEIIHLVHKNGDEFIGTRFQFVSSVPKAHAGNLSSLISGKIQSTLGWRLYTSPIRQQDMLHKFTNDDGTIFIGTTSEFIQKFNMNQGNVWCLVNRKHGGKHHVLGWRVTKPSE